MQKIRKRKQTQENSLSSLIKFPRRSITEPYQPYPDHPRPTAEECLAVRDTLLSLHGFPKEFIEFRNQRLLFDTSAITDQNATFGNSLVSENDSGNSSKASVLDGLVSTILSQNTTDVNSRRAFASLKSAFPTWEDVLAVESNHLEDAIRCGGLAPTKASCIKSILNCLFKKRGNLCLEYLRDLSVEEVKAELSQFKGIGPKTVACVLMFHLQRDDFPVDTHVFHIAKSIGWTPAVADVKKTYLHLNHRIPNNLKFDLNCLLFTHGKLCGQCSRKGNHRPEKQCNGECCPLLTQKHSLE